MTYEHFCANVKALVKEADTYNKWVQRAKYRLLSDVAPRLATLSKKMYMGCGFHYSLELELAKLVKAFAYPIHWNGNHYENIPEQRVDMLINQIVMRELVKSVVKAEKSAGELARR